MINHSITLLLICFISFEIFSQDSKTNRLPEISFNGTFINNSHNQSGLSYSSNKRYKATFNIREVTDGNRILENFNFYFGDKKQFYLRQAPGSDFDISNEGFIVFYDHSFHFLNKLTLNFFNKDGAFIFDEVVKNGNAFAFSESGKLFAYRDVEKLKVTDLTVGSSFVTEKGLTFCFDETDERFAIADAERIKLYNKGQPEAEIYTTLAFPRKLAVSSIHDRIAIINKNTLQIYSLKDKKLIKKETIPNQQSFRDLIIDGNKILLGVHTKNENESEGFARVYSLSGKLIETIAGEKKSFKKSNKTVLKSDKTNSFDPIPWPFFPFDSMRTVWNHYEQHMGGSSTWSYLHQGLDLITPVGEQTYAVKSGIVKCVLTIGGASYWRIAISDSQNSGVSDGWLYAHLIENSIQFDIGDTVQTHDYLGDIIQWSDDWGHIHFVEIKDSGDVWLYSDNEWGINFNPLLALTPLNDYTAPLIDNVFPDSKFAFCTNETSNYFNPDSISGNVDIIVKVIDYAGNSEWQQPAFKIYYWIKRISDDEIIIDRKLSHILNHPYAQYASGYYEPYATVLYKRDNLLPSPSWMDTVRAFYHVITNNNGDSLIEISEKDSAFRTTDYYDGDYRIYVEAHDEAGNFTLDSMDVKFKNNISDIDDGIREYNFSLFQNYPNPFNPATKIKYFIPSAALHQTKSDLRVTLKVFDLLGREIATLVNEEQSAGEYEVEFSAIGGSASGGNTTGLSSGVYYYQLRVGSFMETRKMLMIK